MNHSINNLLWITLFAVLYISSVIGQPPPELDGPTGDHCAIPGHAESCTDCVDADTCLDAANLGPDGCRCKTLNFPAVCGDATCDPTSDPTVDPTIDPTQMPTTPTSHPSTTPTSNPSITPTSNPSNNPTSNPSITPTNNPSMPSITPT
eukprot:121421_1